MTDIEGITIEMVRPMTREERIAEGWGGRRPPAVLVLDDGTKLYPSRDSEGNGPGELFGMESNGEFIMVTPDGSTFNTPTE